MRTPFQESSSMRSRRLFVLVALALAPMFAACGTMPTANEDPAPPAPTDTTKRRDQQPWN